MSLFDAVREYSQDIFRNIRGIKVSQDLFDDLSDDPANWEAANTIESHTHPVLTNQSLIQRAFDYSKNDFIDYPFEKITSSRYSDGAIACWYGSETLKTTIYETRYHFMQEIKDSWEIFQTQDTVIIDRRVAKIYCQGLGLDLTGKKEEFPWLIDPNNYTQCQETGRRVAHEGHPLLIVPSARDPEGINLVVFNPALLSNPREYCRLKYIFDTKKKKIQCLRGEEEIILEQSSMNI
ncbi:RES family NAD+ phosphorylase [Legionella anisa]|uniref:RES domain-containing protein n=1 Tax=Legionella anisa TaxID=28082 RepID=A0AAX0WX60_9GAMM|nr:RES family NAD+ phosphorylase [Legionella anisa]AWN72501.1 RES domain-containing protein [Legionella anisa]KTC74738.1 RES domain-containing protein [Legionella anisa]MBN5936828.1 RES family NAD+ phosphorylase [Legionella anisa]MCW8423268.1 RES family NAD+ phosphorylase [Legionella anisa]MCW8446787.1 RES family NAD+ phosphorylase [Legionella anisa]